MNKINSFNSIFPELSINAEEKFYRKDFENKKELLLESILEYISKIYPSLILRNQRKHIYYNYEYKESSNELLFQFNVEGVFSITRNIIIEKHVNTKQIYKYLILEKDIFSNYELFMIKNMITQELEKLNIKEDIDNITNRIKITYDGLIQHEESLIHFNKYIPMLKKYYKIKPKISFQESGFTLQIEFDQNFITKKFFYHDFYFSINKNLDIFESLFIREFNKLKLEYYELILKKIKDKIKKMNQNKIEPIYFLDYNEFILTSNTYKINDRFREKKLYANIFLNYQEYLRLRKKLYKYRDSYFTLTLNKKELYNIEKKEMSLFIDKETYNYLHRKTKFKRKKITLKNRKD